MKKKIFSFVLAICLIIPCAIAFVGCGSNDESEKVMNVSLNPKLEFVLNKNNRVVTVNAINEEGNHIIALAVDEANAKSFFEGMTAEDAVELFLELTKENGYLISGNDEKIEIEISGDANKLMKSVKNTANKYFEKYGFDVSVVTDAIKKEEIANEVKKCLKEISSEELDGMSQEKLVELLMSSRKETKLFYSQELKEAYYNMREEKLNIAELEQMLSIIENLNGMDNALVLTFKANVKTLIESYEALEKAYNDQLLSETSLYYKAKKAYIQAKETLLAKRLELAINGLTEQEKQILESFESSVESAKTLLDEQKSFADNAIASAKTALGTMLNSVKTGLEIVKTTLEAFGANLSTVDNAKAQVKISFKDYFAQRQNFKEYVGYKNVDWDIVR